MQRQRWRWKGREGKEGPTIRLLKHPVHSARAAAAGHGDVEVVVVGGLGGCHCSNLFVDVRYKGEGRALGETAGHLAYVFMGVVPKLTGLNT